MNLKLKSHHFDNELIHSIALIHEMKKKKIPMTV